MTESSQSLQRKETPAKGSRNCASWQQRRKIYKMSLERANQIAKKHEKITGKGKMGPRRKS